MAKPELPPRPLTLQKQKFYNNIVENTEMFTYNDIIEKSSFFGETYKEVSDAIKTSVEHFNLCSMNKKEQKAHLERVSNDYGVSNLPKSKKEPICPIIIGYIEKKARNMIMSNRKIDPVKLTENTELAKFILYSFSKQVNSFKSAKKS